MNAMGLGSQIIFWTMVVEICLLVIYLVQVGTANQAKVAQPQRRITD